MFTRPGTGWDMSGYELLAGEHDHLLIKFLNQTVPGGGELIREIFQPTHGFPHQLGGELPTNRKWVSSPQL
jgi:hypothetical protein